MSRVVAVSGIGDDAPPLATSPRTMLAWGLVLGATFGIFIGTLLLKPSRKRS